MNLEEEWKTVWNYPKYEVSNLGRVRYKKTGRIKSLVNSDGYKVVCLFYKDSPIGVHRLVFEAFYRRLLPNEDWIKKLNMPQSIADKILRYYKIHTQLKIQEKKWGKRKKKDVTIYAVSVIL